MTCRITAILLFISAFAVKAADQPGILKGRIYDSQTLEPLPRASIFYGCGLGTVSGIDGTYLLQMEPGNRSLTFRYVGYRSVTRSVSVEAGDTVILDVRLEQALAEIDQVVVSAGKAEQRVSELTVSVNIIKPELISSSHITDATELISRTPGIEVMDGQASIRGGSGFSYGAGSRVLALIDGLPVLSADAGSIKWQFLPMENISQIEVIKGASSVLYGSSALNGVINFRTARAGSEPVTRFYLESGVFGRPENRDWIWWDSPRAYYSTSLSHMQRSGNTGLGFAIHLLNDNGYRRLNDVSLGRVNIFLRHDDKSIEGLHYGVNINAGLTRKTDFILWENAWTGALRQNESTANRLYGNLVTIDPYVTLETEGRSVHNLRARLQSSENRFPEAGQNDSRALSLFAEYQLSYGFSPDLEVNFGIMENYSHVSSPFYGNHEALNLAVYTQTDISLSDRLKFVAGVRLEYNSLDGVSDRLVPLFRAGVNYRLLDYTFLRGSFGQGYRYPSIAERHAATTIGSVRIVPNPEVEPESGWSSEVGIKQGIMTGRLNGQVDLALFYSENTGMIEYLFGIYPDPAQGALGLGFMATNVEQSRVYGTEIEFALSGSAGRFTNSVSGGYVFIYPVEYDPETGRNSDVYLKYRRMHSLKLYLRTEYRRFDLGVSLRAGSRILNIDEVFLIELNSQEAILPGFYDYWNESRSGHFLIDQHAGFAINEKLRISLAVKNLLNTIYMGRPGDIMPHRNYSLRLTGSF